MEGGVIKKLRDLQAFKIPCRHELVTNVLNSQQRDLEKESDFQVYLDENKGALYLEDLPQAPIWLELCEYLQGKLTPFPLLRIPLSAECESISHNSELSFNSLFLALMASYKCLPSFNVPSTLGEQTFQLRCLIWALKKSQEECFGVVNEVCYSGIEFLARLATFNGVSLVFDKIEFGPLGSLPQGKAKWALKRGFTHRKPSEWLPQLRKNFSVLDDLSHLIQNQLWAVKEANSVKVERVGATLLSFIGNDSETRSLSAFSSTGTQIEHWMRAVEFKGFH